MENLERASFVRSYTSLHQKGNRSQKYKLFDEFLIFYYKFMKPHNKIITESESNQLFENLVESSWDSWLGIAFETFYLKNALYLAEKAGIGYDILSYSPLYSLEENTFQFDLIYERKGGVRSVCEIKFYNKPIGTWIISEMNQKLKKLPVLPHKSIEKILIAPFGADKSLIQSEYFHHIISLKEIF